MQARLHWRISLIGVLMLAFVVSAQSQETAVRRTTLIVHDIDTSIAFYSQVLDFEVWLDLPGEVSEQSLPSDARIGDPSRFVIMKGKHPWIGMIGLLQYGKAQPAPQLPNKLQAADVVLMLETESLDLIYERMLAANTPILRPKKTATVTGADGRRWDATFVFAFDPDGHLLELNQRALPGDKLSSRDILVRRRYVDYPFGQLHMRVATPTRQIVSEPPLVLFHQTPLSGRMFDLILPELAQDRVVYAVDTPGYGESDPPPEPFSIEQYAQAMSGFVSSLGSQVDLLGYHTGVLLALELANSLENTVRKTVLVAVPLFDEKRRKQYKPNREVLKHDGAHLTEMWESTMRARPPGQSMERAAQLVAEKQRAGAQSWWAGPAIFGFDTHAALKRLRQPALVIRPGDGLSENTAEAITLLPAATVIEYPQFSYGFFDANAKTVASDVLDYLNQKRR